MKKNIKTLSIITVVVIMALTSIMLCACTTNGANEDGSSKTYTIQYSDDEGLHTFTVESGALYSIENVPQRKGYDFLGLFDDKTDGTQYIDENGSCVSAFRDNRNMVLYPHFKAKEYTLVLDYQGAKITGERSIKVTYDQTIESLPEGLTLDNKTFVGWYTEPDKKGTQIADADGILPDRCKVNERNFDLTNPDGYIRLYAGFKGKTYIVRFYFGDNQTPEEVEVEHGTYIADVPTKTRVGGKAAVTWSTDRRDMQSTVFNGKVESAMTLYAYEYAPVIDFDSNGGEDVNPIVRKAGSAIQLPTPTRENYHFVGWYTENGEKFTASTMGADSVLLKAKWYAMLIFDTNGGTPVDNIAQEQGTAVDLSKAVPSKEGFMFAGWYTERGARYTDAAMPSYSIKLFAKYYKTVKEIQLLVEGSEEIKIYYGRMHEQVDLSSYFNNGITEVNVKVHYEARIYDSSLSPTHTDMHYMEWYNSSTISELFKVWTYDGKHDDNQYHVYEHEGRLTLTASNNIFYVYYFNTSITSDSQTYKGNIRDWWLEITYPDKSQLF